MKQVLTGHSPELVKALDDAGILPDNCRRLVIDIAFDGFVTLYTKSYADERLLDVDLGAHLSVIGNNELKDAKK